MNISINIRRPRSALTDDKGAAANAANSRGNRQMSA